MTFMIPPKIYFLDFHSNDNEIIFHYEYSIQEFGSLQVLWVHMGLQAFYQCCAGVARFEAGTYTLVLVMLGQQRIC